MTTKTVEDKMVDILKVKSRLYDMMAEYGEMETLTAMSEVMKDIRSKYKTMGRDIERIDDLIFKLVDE